MKIPKRKARESMKRKRVTMVALEVIMEVLPEVQKMEGVVKVL
jgi:hypothetical protein